MNRSRAIASTLAVSAVIISATVAGVAIVNATDTDAVTEGTTLVVDTAPDAAAPFTPQPLPDISLAPLPVPDAPLTVTETAPEDSAATSSFSRDDARSLVLAQAPGEVVKTWSTVRDGYRAYAVKVLRPDGSLATGFVDRATGVVFDWTTVAAKAQASSGDDDDSAYADDDDDDSDDHEDEGDEVENESHEEDDD